MSFGRVELSGGALLAAAILLFLDENELAGWIFLACLCHELGHWWAIRALGGRVSRVRISCAGAEMRLSAAHPLTPKKVAAAALAGPGVNLLLFWGSTMLARFGKGEQFYFFAGINLGLAWFNLLPVNWLDGGKILESIFTLFGLEELGRRATDLCADLAAGLLLAGGLVLLWQSGGRCFTFLVAGLWLAAAGRRKREERSVW